MQNLTIDNLIVVLDLGTSMIRGVVGRKDYHGRVEIIASEKIQSKGIKRGAISNLEGAAFCIKQVLSLLQNKVNIYFNEGKPEDEKRVYEITGTYVGLNGQTIKTLKSNVPRILGEREVTEDDIKTLLTENFNVKIENHDILDIITEEFLVDDTEEEDPVGCICTRIEGRYKIVAGRSTLKNNLKTCFEKAGYKLNGYFLSPVMSASAVLSYEEKQLGTAMIDFGAGTTSLVVYYKNKLRHVSVIPFGSNVVTKDIMDLKVLEGEAEKLKIKFGSAMQDLAEDFNIATRPVAEREGKVISSKFLAGIIEARMDEILEYVTDQLRKSGMENQIDGLVITGGGSKLNNLVEKLKLKTGLDVRVGVPSQKISTDMDEAYLQVEYAQLIGLLLYAQPDCLHEKVLEQITEPDLNTEKEKKNKPQKKGKKIWGTLFDKIDEIFTEDSKI